MCTLGYKSCMADADLWYKQVFRPDDGYEYYAYVLWMTVSVFIMMQKKPCMR